MHLFTFFAADQAAGVVVATVVLLAALAPLAMIPFTLAWSNKGLHGAYKKIRGAADKLGSNAKGAAGSVGKMATSGIKQDVQGKLASKYDPTKKPYAGSNLAIRAALGKLSPSKTATRQVVSAGAEYTQKQATDAQKLLTAGRVTDGKDLAKLASGGVVTTATGGTLDSRRDPALQRAAIKGVIASKDAGAFEKVLQNGNTNWAMVNEEVGAAYGDVSGMGAHLPAAARASLKTGQASTRDQLNSLALVEQSKLGYGALATQKADSLTAALKGAQSNPAADEIPTIAAQAHEALTQPGVAKDIKPDARLVLQQIAALTPRPAAPAAPGGPAPAPIPVPVPAPGPAPAPPTPTPVPMPTTPVTITRPSQIPPSSPGGPAPVINVTQSQPLYTQAYPKKQDLVSLGTFGIRNILGSAPSISALSDRDVVRLHTAARDIARSSSTEPGAPRNETAEQLRQTLRAERRRRGL